MGGANPMRKRRSLLPKLEGGISISSQTSTRNRRSRTFFSRPFTRREKFGHAHHISKTPRSILLFHLRGNQVKTIMKNQGQGVEVHGLTSDRLKEKELSTDSFDEGGDDNDDHEGSLSESSGTTGTGQQSKAEKEEHAVQFARKETEQICWLRGTVSIVMVSRVVHHDKRCLSSYSSNQNNFSQNNLSFWPPLWSLW